MNDNIPVFQFKESDDEGLETLQIISDAVKFNDWMYETIEPFCQGKILEIGSGIGNISERFISNNQDITLSEIRINYRTFLSDKFPLPAKEGKIVDLDLVHPQFTEIYKSLLNSYDTVFALNVVEHIKDDKTAIKNCNLLLKPGGTLIILVPAFQTLYNYLDKELYHYRRYTKQSLKSLFQINDIKISKSFYFNAAGIPAWFVSGRLQKNKTIPKGQMNFFNTLVPIFKMIDMLVMKQVGLSAICIGTKQ